MKERTVVPPPLRAEFDVLEAYLIWATQAFACGDITANEAEQHRKMVAEMRQVMAERHKESELEEMKKIEKNILESQKRALRNK